MNNNTTAPLLSLIICAYNVERFMRTGLDALLAMKGDYEVVICDDGSTDNTGVIADEYAMKYAQVRVIHQENTGLGGARNTAMDAARGQYIGFYDVDDKLSHDYFSVLQNVVSIHRPDVLMFGYCEVNEFYHSSIPFSFNSALYQNNQDISKAYIDAFSGVRFNNGFTWNKLYRRAFLTANNLRFGNQRIQQDEVFNCKVYARAQSIQTIPDILYNYYIYQTGNNRSRYIANRLDIYRDVRDALTDLCNYWQLKDSRIYDYINRRFFVSVLEYLNLNLHHKNCPMSKQERFTTIAQTMRAEDVVVCTKSVIKQKDISNRIRQYAEVILRADVTAYERMRMSDNNKTELKLILHRIKNKFLMR
jgi:glycosyltransferase involved in cell wall biosynthesis